MAACSDGAAPQMASAHQALGAPPSVRFSEIHYDNTGADVGEQLEVSGPAGMDVTGWQVILYNGSGGASYSTTTLSGAIPATAGCDPRGVIVIPGPTAGIQNGSPDGMALVDNHGAVIEFLSYEGTFAATNGPASGLTSTDIGVSEDGTGPIGSSLQRNADGTWNADAPSTFGTCNDNGAPPPPPPDVASVTVAPATASLVVGGSRTFTATALDAQSQPISGTTFTWTTSDATVATVSPNGLATAVAAGGPVTLTATAPNGVFGTATLTVTAPTNTLPDTRFSEIHYDNVGVDTGEAIEIEGPAGEDISGWSIVLYDGGTLAVYSTTVLPAGSLLDATHCTDKPGRGVFVQNYPSNGIQNGSPDGFALLDAAGHLVEFLSYEGSFTAVGPPIDGVTSTDIIAQEASSEPIGESLQRDDNNRWAVGGQNFGACNPATTTGPGNSISFSGRVPSDPALPVGFQDQVFATERDGSNQVVSTTFTWSSDTPDIATIDQNGVFTALAVGTMTLRATATDGTSATYQLPTRIAVASTTAHYDGNTEFGEPTDADPSDDFIVHHVEYTSSFNPNKGIPNWVAYDLDASAFGPEDRCDCFTFDPDLPATFLHYTTADYTGSGAIAGYGIDRGHMTRSFDRTSASLDNAHTFLFSNVMPQASDLNQGPWALFEDFLGDQAMNQNKEVYIIAGGAGEKGTLKNEGKIVIPESTWKIAVIMPRDHGLADIHDYRDLQVIAVNMPNEPGVRNVPWQTYQTTVDDIEQLTGYDFLALLPDKIENIVEAGIQPPLAFLDGPYSGNEGSTISMSGAASVDPNGTVVDYEWSFGDGTTASGPTVTHTYAQDGTYTVTLIVTDNDGLTDSNSAVATVANVPPVVSAIAGASLFPGEAYTAAGSFTDPGADPWTATVDYGDGTGAQPLALTGKTFALAHTYAAAGTFTVTVTVTDDHTPATSTATVVVESAQQGITDAANLIAGLVAAGKLDRGFGTLLQIELGLASQEIGRGHKLPAQVLLRGTVAELDLLVRFGFLAADDAAPTRALLVRVIQSLGH